MKESTQSDPYSPEGCFIATACYGTGLDEHVQLLKDFRDSFLKEFSLGRAFIRKYYEYSPPVADFIQDKKYLKVLIRVLLVQPAYLISKALLRLKALFD